MTYSGFKSRAQLTWHITPDIMAYYTFSQGFRPGGFNRSASAVALGRAAAWTQFKSRTAMARLADKPRNRHEGHRS